MFFDGVPNPYPTTQQASLPGAPAVSGGVGRHIVLASTHKPHAEEKCQECHDTRDSVSVSVSVLNPELCLKCHDKLLDKYPAMHGPVVSKACLWCHEPHGSEFPSLLRTNSPSLCTQCHERVLLSPGTPEHKSGETSCLTCHTGHGGDHAPFLKAGATTAPVKAAEPNRDGRAPGDLGDEFLK